ncbi:MAG: hypothetical protein RSE25_04740 [Bacteroidales bacterium]
MQTITREYTVYQYSELLKETKEKVKEKYVEFRCNESSFFGDDLEFEADCFFPNSELKFQFSLSYSQGDGLNVYGKLRLYDILPHLNFSKKEKRTLSYYITNGCDYVDLPYNGRYAYCIVDRAGYTAEMLYQLEQGQTRNINRDLIERFEGACIDYLKEFCDRLEKQGYAYFYEPEEGDIEEWADSLGFFFLESGDIFEQ